MLRPLSRVSGAVQRHTLTHTHTAEAEPRVAICADAGSAKAANRSTLESLTELPRCMPWGSCVARTHQDQDYTVGLAFAYGVQMRAAPKQSLIGVRWTAWRSCCASANAPQ